MEKDDPDKLPYKIKKDVVAALLAASETPGPGKDDFIKRAAELAKGLQDVYEDACIAQRESTRQRILGEYTNSTLILDRYQLRHNCSGFLTWTDKSLVHATNGQLLVSSAILDLQQEKLSQALDKLRVWAPLNRSCPASIEQYTQWSVNLTQGKILRYQGDFSDAFEVFTRNWKLEEVLHLSNIDRCDFYSNLADVLIEQGHTEEAQNLLQNEIQRLSKLDDDVIKELMLLKLSFAEAYLRQGRTSDALVILSDLEAKQNTEPTLTRLGRLRLWIGLARVRHQQSDWGETQKLWTKAIDELRSVPLVNGWTTRVILLSMQLVSLKIEDVEMAVKSRKIIGNIAYATEPEGCKYWIAGLGSYWFDYVRDEGSRYSH